MPYLLKNTLTDILNPLTTLTIINPGAPAALKNPDDNNIFNIATNYSYSDQNVGSIVTGIGKSAINSTISMLYIYYKLT